MNYYCEFTAILTSIFGTIRLHGFGWGAKRLAHEFGCARNTVRHIFVKAGRRPFRPPAWRSALDGLDRWLRERFFRHGGNADVIRQELAAEHGIVVSLRHIERRVVGWRRELKIARSPTSAFTAPLASRPRCASRARRALRPFGGRAPFGQLRDLDRVQADCAVDIDTNSYSVPWQLIGETVQMTICAGRIIIRHAGEIVAEQE